jgi:APA family basic amino acid/polyamine antiporter
MSNSLFRKKRIESILAEGGDETHGAGLKRVLSVRDLTFFGIAAILGAGSFSSLGGAVFHGGPGVVILFIITAIACAFTAFCYSEFASRIPVAGSAYTYAYASFGELFAWIIGWDLLLEYGVSCSAVAIGWSGYLDDILNAAGVQLPTYLLAGPWQGGIVNLPAMLIILALTILLIIGVHQSARFNSMIVFIKLLAISVFVGVAVFYIKPINWHPFMPFGWHGVVSGAALVFFAYIGFDAVSTAAQEAKNPKKDMPMGILGSLAICTVLYILFAYVLTGVASTDDFRHAGKEASVAYAIQTYMTGFGWLAMNISTSLF